MTEPSSSEPFVRPDVALFLKYLNSVPGPKIHEIGAVAAREMSRGMRDIADLPTGPLAVLRDLTMPGPGGGEIALRLFDDRETRAPGPVLVFFHGGGWVLGDLDGYEPPCAEMARALDLPVVSVDYRLAPESPWPAGPDDAEAAARWVAGAPDALGLTPTSLVLAGDSAGGTLTIVTAIALRDEPAAVPAIAHWAIYPAADLATHYPSYTDFREGYFLTEDSIRWFGESYAPDVTDWRGSPMVAPLAGLSRALVTTASLDPIRDQGRAYAAGLAQAGVPVSFREATGNIHGFINIRKAIPSAQADFLGDLAVLKTIIAEAQA